VSAASIQSEKADSETASSITPIAKQSRIVYIFAMQFFTSMRVLNFSFRLICWCANHGQRHDLFLWEGQKICLRIYIFFNYGLLLKIYECPDA
jgi:hypothetical protein